MSVRSLTVCISWRCYPSKGAGPSAPLGPLRVVARPISSAVFAALVCDADRPAVPWLVEPNDLVLEERQECVWGDVATVKIKYILFLIQVPMYLV